MATEQRPFHLVVFGASGFTGQFVTEEVAREQIASEQSSRLPWAVAGRSKEKLQQVLEKAAQKLGRPSLSSEVGVIICDISNPASLDEMAKQAKLVLNCVGPYRFYGEPVVKACIENGTSCIDICGEPQFLELMHAKYHEKAAEKGVYIIGSSGFDSIPADLGVLYTRNQMNGTLTAVESFLTINTGPEMDETSFTMTFFGQGYSHGTCVEKNKPNIRICTQVKGPEAGYVATPIAMVQAAMTFLSDASDLPKGGGVFTPGAAFSRTKLIDRLNKHGIEFSVISSSEV